MTSAGTPGADLGQLTYELFRQARIVHLVKARLSADSGGLDSGALGVLVHVVKSGGLRQRDLADNAMLDPSTVSRYVGLLVKGGLVERQADQEDGRAVRLVATEAGHAMHRRLVARREALMSEALAGWSADEVADLTAGLRRLNDDFEALRTQPGLHPFRHPILAAGAATPSPAAGAPAGPELTLTHEQER